MKTRLRLFAQRLVLPCTAAMLTLLAAPASAQFGFSIPGLPSFGGGSRTNSGNSLDQLQNVQSLVGNLNKALTDIDEPEEKRIGQEFAETLLGAKPLLNDARVQRYVNALGRWLALQTERPDLSWTFGVLDDPGFNAFATPGGNIFVTRGLMGRMRNEAELAGVLAHEIAHVLQKHHLKAVQKNARTGVLADALAAGRGGSGAQARAVVVDLGRKLYARGLDKEDEFEADQLGVIIAARAGYDPYGLPSVLQMLQAQSAQDADFALLFGTHPTPSARIEALARSMENRLDNLPVAPSRALAERIAEASR